MDSHKDDDEAATAAYHGVLFSQDLWTLQLFPLLHRASKVVLRCVNKNMCSQVDASIEVVASPVSGSSPDALSAALVRWSGMHDLTLLAVKDADLVPLATASLAGLTSLTVRQADPDGDLDVPMFSSRVAATLQVIDISDCRGLCSIDFVRGCAQLRSLWMPFVNIPDLSPLAACSETLEELWTDGSDSVVSLAPLKACNSLRKLDLRGRRSALHNQVEDLRLVCPQLADPASVEVEGLVHDLQRNMSPNTQCRAAYALSGLGSVIYNKAAIAADAIPALVQLRRGSSSSIWFYAVVVLCQLAHNHAENQAACVAAGAVPAVRLLLGRNTPTHVWATAEEALHILGVDAQ
ncbi:hypothetical protein FOA52_013777 [Chlamydomonas sp. UWO 241]|nr:hypothetical protein FOA52_013777 [Chlamydomonas sp. UWO 241]